MLTLMIHTWEIIWWAFVNRIEFNPCVELNAQFDCCMQGIKQIYVQPLAVVEKRRNTTTEQHRQACKSKQRGGFAYSNVSRICIFIFDLRQWHRQLGKCLFFSCAECRRYSFSNNTIICWHTWLRNQRETGHLPFNLFLSSKMRAAINR